MRPVVPIGFRDEFRIDAPVRCSGEGASQEDWGGGWGRGDRAGVEDEELMFAMEVRCRCVSRRVGCNELVPSGADGVLCGLHCSLHLWSR